MNTLTIDNLDLINQTARKFIQQMGDNKIFAFNGNMGAGKTTFIKAICEELGVTDMINSPSFAIINEYSSNSSGEQIFHFDFYRIDDIEEAYQIGTPDYFSSGFLCFIEWPERIMPLLPNETVFVRIDEQEDGSRIVAW
ncbi:tRNA (adenosine(37)-N6)-threonylcarbamoyltransferase complex ATPase subunit type 1 TsaE [Bacteroidales bacterium OttesenSCG-928-M11]|nr:tRNA (adenosine(37)-N6)-threonylcarbamoyltransferase complex ATPase subunit type 1 TsaE [Bacteroidales bacterium OttesenSCG-928-M11]